MNLADSFLLEQFRTFYEVLANEKSLIQSGRWTPPRDDPQGIARGVDAISRRLMAELERQALEADRQGLQYSSNFYREAQYVMAALADDFFVHFDWPGRQAWKANLLEYRLFETYVAGEMVYHRIERLLRNLDPVYRDLGAVYFMALALGFEGKYWGGDDRSRIEAYKHRLHTFIFGSKAGADGHALLFPEAYAHTLHEGTGRRLPNVRLWLMVLASLVLVYLFVSHRIWTSRTQTLQQEVGEIRSLGLASSSSR